MKLIGKKINLINLIRLINKAIKEDTTFEISHDYNPKHLDNLNDYSINFETKYYNTKILVVANYQFKTTGDGVTLTKHNAFCTFYSAGIYSDDVEDSMLKAYESNTQKSFNSYQEFKSLIFNIHSNLLSYLSLNKVNRQLDGLKFKLNKKYQVVKVEV